MLKLSIFVISVIIRRVLLVLLEHSYDLSNFLYDVVVNGRSFGHDSLPVLVNGNLMRERCCFPKLFFLCLLLFFFSSFSFSK